MNSRQASLGYRVRDSAVKWGGGGTQVKQHKESVCSLLSRLRVLLTRFTAVLKNAALQMGDKYRKNTPKRQPEKQRLKVCGQGSCPTQAITLCNPGRSHTAAHPDTGPRGHTPSVPLTSAAPVLTLPGFWESLCWGLSEEHHTRAGTPEGHWGSISSLLSRSASNED